MIQDTLMLPLPLKMSQCLSRFINSKRGKGLPLTQLEDNSGSCGFTMVHIHLFLEETFGCTIPPVKPTRLDPPVSDHYRSQTETQ